MKKLLSYKTLRIVFIIGFLICTILYFVPFRSSPIEGEERPYSYFEMSRLAAKMGELIAALAIYLAIVILAIIYPKRGIFLIGAILMAFSLFIGLFNQNIQKEIVILFPYVIDRISRVMGLTGFLIFFIKPKKKT
ncbi:MAG: hypothetical protein JSV96_15615 [Candidatus Aminicenantes bacterium]|nr:MAG: hypothetical protein JSV96_15615 [Candidatus Aminicenantes bacterium]